jgi:hypothetical protein
MDEYLCINDVFTAEQKRGFENLPVKGETYTLKEEVKSTIDNKIGLVFYELPNPSHPNGQEYSFRPSRFVKVDKTKGQTELVEEKERVHVLEKNVINL